MVTAVLSEKCSSRLTGNHSSQRLHSNCLCGASEVGARSHLVLRDSQATGVMVLGVLLTSCFRTKVPSPTEDVAAGLIAGLLSGIALRLQALTSPTVTSPPWRQ